MTPAPLIPLPVEAIVKAYLAGDGLTDLATRYGVANRTIRRRLLDAGVKMRPKGGRKKGVYPVAEAIELYATGLSVEQVAKRLGCARATLYQEMVMAGWTARPCGWGNRKPEAVREEVARMAGKNMRLADIAARNDVCIQFVKDVIREDGIERQRVGKTSAPMRRVFLYGPGDVPVKRWCAPCGDYHKLREFGKNKRLKHGVAQACLRSCAARTRAYAARREQQESASPR